MSEACGFCWENPAFLFWTSCRQKSSSSLRGSEENQANVSYSSKVSFQQQHFTEFSGFISLVFGVFFCIIWLFRYSYCRFFSLCQIFSVLPRVLYPVLYFFSCFYQLSPIVPQYFTLGYFNYIWMWCASQQLLSICHLNIFVDECSNLHLTSQAVVQIYCISAFGLWCGYFVCLLLFDNWFLDFFFLSSAFQIKNKMGKEKKPNWLGKSQSLFLNLKGKRLAWDIRGLISKIQSYWLPQWCSFA